MSIPTNVRPILPDPPDEYDPEYIRQLVRELENFIASVNNSGDVQASSVRVTKMPTSTTGQKSGTLWNDTGTVKIVP